MTSRYILRNVLVLQTGYFIFSLGGLSLKFASGYSVKEPLFYFFYVSGLFFMLLFAILWQHILKTWSLTNAYAWKCSAFFWSFLWAVFFFGETITGSNLLGAAIIVMGVVMVNKSE